MRKQTHSLATLFIVLVLLLAVPVTVLADGGSGGMEKEVNGYHVKLIFAEPVKSGANSFHLQITDSMGMPVTNAEIEIEAMPVEGMDEHSEAESLPVGVMTSNNDMAGMEMATEEPATGVMKPNNTESESGHGSGGHAESVEPIKIMLAPSHEAGEYAGEAHFEKSGEWMFNVHFTVNGSANETEFSFDVARALVMNYAIQAGFLGINATVIASAAALKRKSIRK